MADPKIKFKRSSVQGKRPTVDQVPLGEAALNTFDGRLYVSKSTDGGITTSVVNLSGFNLQDEGSFVGYANTVNFVGGIISVGVDTNVGIATVTLESNLVGTALSISGISTFTNGPVLIGSATSTGTAGQILQVAGINSGVYIGGNLGIGNTNPSVPFQIGNGNFGNVAGQAGIGIDPPNSSIFGTFGTGGGIRLRAQRTSDTGGAQIFLGGSTRGDSDVNAIIFFNGSSQSARLDSNGNLGIGTTNPQTKLDIVGDARISGVVTATGGFNIGIQSAGVNVVTGVITALNFVGTGNTFLYNPVTKTVDISIQGGGGGGGTGGDITVQANNTLVAAAQTTLNFAGTGVTAVSIGKTTTITIEPGLVGAAKSAYSFTATAGQTVFNVNYSQGQENVFLNGVRLSESEYIATSGSSITLKEAAAVGDIVDVVVYLRGSDPNRNINVTLTPAFNGITTAFTMRSAGNLFSPVDDKQILVSVGGVIQQPGIAYTVGTGSSIFFSSAPSIGATCFITALYSTTVGVPTDSVRVSKQVYNVTGIQTTFTVTDTYKVDYLDVYRNGIRLVSGSDFTATNGTTFDLVTPANASDVVEAVAYRTFFLNYAEFAGLSTNVNGGYADINRLNVSGISTLGNVLIGVGGTDLLVRGNSRVTGILTVGQGSITINGITDTISGPTFLNSTNTNITGVATFTNGPVMIGGGTSTGTASQPLQVTGGAYFSGNIGIGTTNPSTKFNLVGDSLVVGISTANSFRARGGAPGALGVNNNGYGFFGSGDNDSGMYSSADGQIEFYSNSSEAARITTNRNLLIGSISETGVSTQRLQVTGGAYFSGSIGIGTTNPASTLDVGGEITIRRTAAGSEGGQINFARASDNTVAWNIDAFGATSTPSLRFIDAIAAASRADIDSSGNFTVTSGNIVIGTSGKGIDFSATANSSGTTTSEVLNDYEEGTWTPSFIVNGSAAGVTYQSGPYGYYTKVGNMVTVWGGFRLSNNGSSTGDVSITGLPFSATNIASFQHPGQGGVLTQLKANSTVWAIFVSGATSLGFRAQSVTNADTPATDSDFDDDTGILFTVTYKA